jgi:hypothetical protein
VCLACYTIQLPSYLEFFIRLNDSCILFIFLDIVILIFSVIFLYFSNFSFFVLCVYWFVMLNRDLFLFSFVFSCCPCLWHIKPFVIAKELKNAFLTVFLVEQLVYLIRWVLRIFRVLVVVLWVDYLFYFLNFSRGNFVFCAHD